MSLSVRSICRGALVAGTALAAGSFATPAFAQMELKIIAPAAPGGGWDQTARSMQQALTADSLDVGIGSGPGMAFMAKGVPAKRGARLRRPVPASRINAGVGSSSARMATHDV